MILETIEPYVEVINLVLALIIVVSAFVVHRRLEVMLKKAWTYFLVAIVLLGLHEVVGSLEDFNIFVVKGLYSFTELIYIIAIIFAVFAFKNMVMDLSKGKKK